MTTILLTVLVIVVGLVFTAIKSDFEHKQLIKQTDSYKTMSLEELLAANDAAESEWDEWNEKWAQKTAWKKDSDKELQKRRQTESKIKSIREEIATRFPDVITDMERAKNKAYSVASDKQKRRMRELEVKLMRQSKAMWDSGIWGYQMLEDTHSSVLNGVVADKFAGPVAGGLAYATTEARNEEVRRSNISKKAQNATWNEMTEGLSKTRLQLKALYEEIIKEHDPKVIVHLYGKENL